MNKENKETFAAFILKHMENNGLDQKGMAALLNIQPSTLCSWLNPKGHGITRKNIERIKFVCRNEVAELENRKAADMSVPASSNIEDFRAGIIGALIDSDLPPESLKIALQIVKHFKLKK